MSRLRTICSSLRVIVLGLLPCLVINAREVAAQSAGNLIAGRELFERVWESGPQNTGPLGPLYNERSCVACHRLGAVGGGGLNARNVTLVSVEIPDSARLPANPRIPADPPINDRLAALNLIRNRVAPVHAGLRNGSIVLHAYAVDQRYIMLREQLLGLRPMDLELTIPTTAAVQANAGPIRRIDHRGATLLVSARNSPAMFGAGHIDRVSLADIKLAAEDQAERHHEMAGRFLGRFGWRGQTLDLRSFVAGACSVELGLDVRNSPATDSPVVATLLERRKSPVQPSGFRSPANPELNDKQFSDLVAFIASLPAPGRRKTVDEFDAAQVRHGEAVFESVDCAVCHRPSLGDLSGLYSDLLLHDMGPGLYDPQPAPLSASDSSRIQYYDSGNSRFGEYVGNRPQEWRTPPLWGVADSGPYLHDGRALTIDDAILMHGGQAAASVRRYRALSEADRRSLIKFLMSLVAPDRPELKYTLAETRSMPSVYEKQLSDAAHQAEQAELAARGRLQLAQVAKHVDDDKTARRWLESIVSDFPDTKTASKAKALLNGTADSIDYINFIGIDR